MPVRMLLFSTIDATKEQEFEAAFSVVRQRVATVPGHMRDELMRKHDEPGAYCLASEWQTREQLVEWLRSPQHDEMTAEMRPYFLRPSDIRFYHVRAT